MAELNWTLETEQWLRDIYDHVAEDNPITAAGVIEGIYERAQVLLDFLRLDSDIRALSGKSEFCCTDTTELPT